MEDPTSVSLTMAASHLSLDGATTSNLEASAPTVVESKLTKVDAITQETHVTAETISFDKQTSSAADESKDRATAGLSHDSPSKSGRRGSGTISPSRKPTYTLRVNYIVKTIGKDGNQFTTQSDESPLNPRNGEVPILELVTVHDNSSLAANNQSTYLNVRSPMIINVLRAVVQYSIENLDGNSVRLESPYKLLYCHEEELKSYKKSHPTTHTPEYMEECNRHLDFLFNFLEMQEGFGRGLQIEKSRWKRSKPAATFKNLWLLIRPSDLVLVDRDNALEPYIVQSITGGIVERAANSYRIALWNLDCDGTYFGRSAAWAYIQPFEGEVEITKLKVFPAKYHPDFDKMKSKFIKRGQNFFKTVKEVTYKEYTGTTVQGEKRKFDRARAVFDYPSWNFNESNEQRHKPRLDEVGPNISSKATCYCEACENAQEKEGSSPNSFFEGWDSIKCKDCDGLRDDQYMLCSRIAWGYILQERQLRPLDIENVTDPQFDTSVIKSLVMDDSKKRVIQAICRKYTLEDEGRNTQVPDMIPGKGEGCIFLLHGSPGVGKTLTAECVAEYTRRPLLTITCGDIGVTAGDVDRNLDTYFNWAEDWRAIVLLDEADIYLERRSKSDIKRNSVVSVFLRALEYYQGILFITTNRVGAFDEAFKSRIHMSIYYKPFDDKMRQQVWENNFEKLMKTRKDEFDVGWNVMNYINNDPELTSMKWNGRQIRNGFQTAVHLAEFDHQEAKQADKDNESSKIPLKKSHFERVANLSRTFEEYLNETRGADDMYFAKIGRYRADDFDEETIGKVVMKSLEGLAKHKKAVKKGNVEAKKPVQAPESNGEEDEEAD